MNHRLTITVHPNAYAICRLEAEEAVPRWASGGEFLSVTRTEKELSIVCEETPVPGEVHAERNRRLLQIEGTLGFTLTGVLASVASPLAEAEISIFAISTYDTDYILVAQQDLERASAVLEEAGHKVQKTK
ncbi:MAG TPA: ACT domain-containing protein [Candidatus Acidoferrum sp.]|nr:ACT domain-containing protein [Candidatus Acidoferrum sp.]